MNDNGRSRHTPVLCPHGIATSWTGISHPGEALPECEPCEACDEYYSALPAGAWELVPADEGSTFCEECDQP